MGSGRRDVGLGSITHHPSLGPYVLDGSPFPQVSSWALGVSLDRLTVFTVYIGPVCERGPEVPISSRGGEVRNGKN